MSLYANQIQTITFYQPRLQRGIITRDDRIPQQIKQNTSHTTTDPMYWHVTAVRGRQVEHNATKKRKKTKNRQSTQLNRLKFSNATSSGYLFYKSRSIRPIKFVPDYYLPAFSLLFDRQLFKSQLKVILNRQRENVNNNKETEVMFLVKSYILYGWPVG